MTRPTDPGPVASTRWVGRVVAAAAVGCTAVPFVAALAAWRGGWMPTSDWASVVVRAHDTLSGNPPLVGIYSSATTSAGGSRAVYHPGPLQEWLLSVPVHVFAPSVVGALLGSAALVSAACAVVFVVAWRRGGWQWLAPAVVLVASFMAATGPAMLREPLHTPLATFAMLAFLAAAWAVLERDEWFWPVAVFAASVAGQAQVAFLVPALTVGTVVVVRRLVPVLSRRDVSDGARPTRRRRRSVVAVTVLVTVFCWAGPLFDQFFRSGNLWALVGTGTGGEAVGPRWAVAEAAKALSVPPSWLAHGLHLSVDVIDDATVVWHTSMLEWATALVTVVVGAGLVARTWRRGPAAHRSLGVVALAAFVGCFLASALLPDEPFSLLGHREIWRSTGLVVWWFLALAAVQVLIDSTPRIGHGLRRAAPRVVPVVTVLVVVGVGAVTLARSSPARDVGSSGFGSVEAFTAAAEGWCAHGPVSVEPATLVDTPTALGVVAMLQLRDCDVRADGLGHILPGDRHRVTGTEPTRLRIDGFAAPPDAACEVIASYDPAHPPERYRDFTSTLDRLQRGGPLYLFACR